MSLQARRIYLLGAIIAFVILAPVFVLYASGFRVNFSDFSIYQTGVLVVGTDPRGANVELNGKALKGLTPIRFSTVNPGTYAIRISKPDYLSWDSHVQVNAKSSTVLSDIPLFFAKPEKKSLWRGQVEAPILAPSNKQIAFATSNEMGNTVHILPLHGAGGQSINNIAPGTVQRMAWGPQESKILLHMVKDETNSWMIVHIASGTSTALHSLNNEQIVNAWWSAHSDDLLFFSTSSGLYRIDLFTGETEQLSNLVATDFIGKENGGYFLASGAGRQNLYWYDPTREDIVTLQNLNDANYRLHRGQDSWFALIDTSKKALTLLQHTPTAPLLTLPLSVPADTIAWNPRNAGEVVVSDGFEINYVNVLTGEVTLVTRKSQKLSTYYWLPGYPTVLVHTQNQIEAYTVGAEYASQTSMLTQQLQNSAVTVLGLSNDGNSILLHETQNETPEIVQYTLR